MDNAEARMMSSLTSDFYRRVSSSFSETRRSAWQGWERAVDIVADVIKPGMSVFDLGCGNLRFERFLADMLEEQAGKGGAAGAEADAPHRAAGAEADAEMASGIAVAPPLLHAYAVDNCAPLVGAEPPDDRMRIERRIFDVAEALLDDDARAFDELACAPSCDLAVAFGLMHHLPTPEQRARALALLVRHVRPGGYVVVSFWQFARNAKLLEKAKAATAEGRSALGLPPFDAGDYLLGWQHEQGVYRFCHHFEEYEIDELARYVEALCGGGARRLPRLDAGAASTDAGTHIQEVARFSADGKQGNLNRYLVMRRL